MPLEQATYISDLVTSNPDPDDKVGTADDHARLIKATLQASFPNITGAMRAGDSALNYLTGVSQDVQQALDDISATLAVIGNALGNASGNVLGLAASVAALNTDVGALEASVSALQTHINSVSANHALTSASVADLRSEVNQLSSQVPGPVYAFDIGNQGTATGHPSGWSVARVGGGQYQITHNLNASAFELQAFVNPRTTVNFNGIASSFGTNSFFVYVYDQTGSLADQSCCVMVVRKP